MARKTVLEPALVILALCFIITIPIVSGYSTGGPKPLASLAEFTDYFDKRVPALMKDYSIPGVNIAVIQQGEITWVKGYGYADLEQGRPMTKDTLLMAQSISNSVTAWGVMKLVEKGKIGFDDSVLEHLQGWKFSESEFPGEKVTIRQLLSLSAGMPLGDFTLQFQPGEETPSLQDTLSGDKARLIFMPGSSFYYSNMSYALLQLLVEDVTGRDFAEYMGKEILLPLGMNNSSFAWDEQFLTRIATGYNLNSQPVPPYVYPYQASGGLFATVVDLARFVIAGMNSAKAGAKILEFESVEQLYAANIATSGIYGFASDSYGLGHFIESLPHGEKAVWHGGQGNGWMTHFHSVPETGDGIVILTNSQRSWPFFSAVLLDWAKWNGFSSIGMGTIIKAKRRAQIIVGLLFLLSLWQASRLARGVISGKRRLAPLVQHARLFRIGQLSLSLVLLSILLWSVNQDYLFIVPVFPILTKWLGMSLLSVAAVSLASACLPECVQ